MHNFQLLYASIIWEKFWSYNEFHVEIELVSVKLKKITCETLMHSSTSFVSKEIC